VYLAGIIDRVMMRSSRCEDFIPTIIRALFALALSTGWSCTKTEMCLDLDFAADDRQWQNHFLERSFSFQGQGSPAN
jgi:hypothetical protein